MNSSKLLQTRFDVIFLCNNILQVDEDSVRKVMIYLGDENSRQNACSSVEECLFICNFEPTRCMSPASSILRKDEGIWSREDANNPFSKYFKVIFLLLKQNIHR